MGKRSLIEREDLLRVINSDGMFSFLRASQPLPVEWLSDRRSSAKHPARLLPESEQVSYLMWRETMTLWGSSTVQAFWQVRGRVLLARGKNTCSHALSIFLLHGRCSNCSKCNK